VVQRRLDGRKHSGAVTPIPVGIVTPMLTAVPGMHSAWETAGSVDALVQVVQCADRLGFDHITCSEHVAVPEQVAQQRGGTYWDPLATLSYLACATSRIRLTTYVLVLGYHHPLALAKRYGTLDRLSGGRVTLGLGVGTLQEEFALLGAPYADRGVRADDALRALRAAMSARTPAYTGSHYAFDGLVVEPAAVQQPVPFWVGGQGERSLRRALQLAQGWAPFGLRPAAVAQMLAGCDVPDGFDVVLPVGPLDPLGAPGAASQQLARAQAAGATRVAASIRSTSPEHYCEQLHALVELPETAT
jgi:probable F420-dependent oxidoreductase